MAATSPISRKIRIEFVAADAAAKEAARVAGEGGAVLWICNTVGAAQSQYHRFKSMGFPVGLLHSRFPFWQRESLETEWMERLGKKGTTRCGSILVSTQIVEQSVDIDADLMITELAPSDMLLQRIGRLWRHERSKRPVDSARICIIQEERTLEDLRSLAPQEIRKELGGKALVYDPFVLLRTMEVWQKHKEILVPGQIRSLIEETYQDRGYEPESWQTLYEDTRGKMLAYRQKALMSSNIWQVVLNDEEGVQTRLNEMPTIALVLCRSLTESEALFVSGERVPLGGDDYRLLVAQAVHRNLVKVPRHLFGQMAACPAFENHLHGEHCIGIVALDETVAVGGLKNGIRLAYSDQLGLAIEKTS